MLGKQNAYLDLGLPYNRRYLYKFQYLTFAGKRHQKLKRKRTEMRELNSGKNWKKKVYLRYP